MNTPADEGANRWRPPRQALTAGLGLIGLLVVVQVMRGGCGDVVAPGVVPLPEEGATGAATAAVVEEDIADVVQWPGTVTARLSAAVAPTVMARVLEVRVQAGSLVRAGDVIASLDARDLSARVEQGGAAVAAAEAQAQQADADLRRARQLFEKEALTPQDLDAAEARAKTMRAQAAQARNAMAEARVHLGETVVRAPFDGVVAQRLVDPGDTAGPGRPVAVLQDPSALRLEADLSERCAAALAVGDALPVRFGAPPVEVSAQVEEIAPVADPASRTRRVKATLPAHPGLRPGGFATLLVACGSHRGLLVPAVALQRSGQLETVRVLVDGAARRRSVRTGKVVGDRVEVLSGVRAGDVVLLAAEPAR